MKRAILIIILFGFNCYLSHANNRCFVTVCLNECITCLNAVSYLETIDPSLETKLVFKNSDSRQIKPFLNEVLGLNWDRNKIIISDSIFNKLNDHSIFSQIYVVNTSGKVMFNCLLKDIGAEFRSINSFKTQASPVLAIKLLPDSIILSQRTNIKEDEVNYYLHDYLFNKIYQVSKSKPYGFNIIGTKNFDKKKIHEACFNYSYESILKDTTTLKALRKDKIEIQNLFLDENIPYALLGYNYVVDSLVKGERTNFIYQKTLLAKFLPNGGIQYYPFTVIPNNDYFINTASDFYISRNKVLVPVRKVKTGKDNRVLASFIISKNKVDFEKILEPQLPDVLALSSLGYNLGSIHLAPPFLGFNLSNNLINYSTNTSLKLPFPDTVNNFNNLLNPTVKYNLLNIQRNGGQIKMLILYKDDYYCIVTDEKFKILENKKLNNNLNLIISNFKFSENKTIIGLDSKNNLLKIKY